MKNQPSSVRLGSRSCQLFDLLVHFFRLHFEFINFIFKLYLPAKLPMFFLFGRPSENAFATLVIVLGLIKEGTF
jgi:hypothetical protein